MQYELFRVSHPVNLLVKIVVLYNEKSTTVRTRFTLYVSEKLMADCLPCRVAPSAATSPKFQVPTSRSGLRAAHVN